MTCTITTVDRGVCLGAEAEVVAEDGAIKHSNVASNRGVAISKAIYWAIDVLGATEIIFEDEDLRCGRLRS